MALVDSEAAFEQRLREVIPTAAVRGSIVNSGIRTFSGLHKTLRPMIRLGLLLMAFCQLDMTWLLTVLSEGFILRHRLW